MRRAGGKRGRQITEQDQARQVTHWQAMRQAATRPLLAQIKGPTAQFQGVQQVAIEAIMDRAP
jgi:hypothetical protein